MEINNEHNNCDELKFKGKLLRPLALIEERKEEPKVNKQRQNKAGGDVIGRGAGE